MERQEAGDVRSPSIGGGTERPGTDRESYFITLRFGRDRDACRAYEKWLTTGAAHIAFGEWWDHHGGGIVSRPEGPVGDEVPAHIVPDHFVPHGTAWLATGKDPLFDEDAIAQWEADGGA